MTVKYIAPATIEDTARQLRTDFLGAPSNTALDSIDIEAIAHRLGCEVQVADFPDDVSAQVLRKEGGKGYIIQVSRMDSPRRQRFSIAHEIAHIFLHDDGKSNFVEKRQPITNYDAARLFKETQANMLAAALLMPEQPVRQLWTTSHSVEALADTFNVSSDAAYNRVYNLGLLTDE